MAKKINMQDPNKTKFVKQALKPLTFKIFALAKLPLAIITGMKPIKFTAEEAVVSIPFKYWTKNPFQSMYFAAQAMAAELSTGLLAMNAIEASGEKLSMLVYDMDAHFSKKAVTKIHFTCKNGREIIDGVKKAIETGERINVKATTVGTDEEGDEVSRFNYIWTFRVKRKR